MLLKHIVSDEKLNRLEPCVQLAGSSCEHCSHTTTDSSSTGRFNSVPQLGQKSSDPVRLVNRKISGEAQYYLPIL
jgi:hypothetical protein